MADFATPAELATFLGAPAYTGAALTRATDMLAMASSLIRLAADNDLSETPGRQESWAGDDEMFRIFLTERPVTAVSAITIDAVAFTEFTWTRWGTITRNDDAAWSVGPILVTYDSGFAAASDEMAQFKAICLEVAARGITRNLPGSEVFSTEIPTTIGWSPPLFLTPEERRTIEDFGPVGVG